MSRRVAATSAAVIGFVLTLSLIAAALPEPADLNTWTAHNQPHTGGTTPMDGMWIVDALGTEAIQTLNGKPTFFASPNRADGYRITATIAAPTVDDDFFGMALGFSTAPSDTTTDYLLIDWRQGEQSIDWLDGTGPVVGKEGLAVSRVTGVATLNELWGHVDSPSNAAGGVAELARGNTFGTIGWSDATSYQFVVEYTTSSLDVWVDGTLEISIVGDFPTGPLAMYDFSQPDIAVSAITFEELNVPPQIDGSGAADISIFEGDVGSTSGAFVDGNDDALALSCSGQCGGFNDDGAGAWSWSELLPEGPDSFSVIITASDGVFEVADTFEVTVTNLAPIITSTSTIPSQFSDDELLSAEADFTDAGVLDTHTAVFDWGDGFTSSAVVNEVDGSGLVSGEHRYAAPGVYVIEVTVWDDDGDSDSAILGEVIIFDPDDFVTGGGWVSSPEGALTANIEHEGKATFGFVVRYGKGGVTGNLEFQLHKSLNVKATAFDSLVIIDGVATFGGEAKVNGVSGYSFEVVATDERHATAELDLLWIIVTGPGGLVYGGPAYPLEGLTIVGKGIQVHDKA